MILIFRLQLESCNAGRQASFGWWDPPANPISVPRSCLCLIQRYKNSKGREGPDTRHCETANLIANRYEVREIKMDMFK